MEENSGDEKWRGGHSTSIYRRLIDCISTAVLGWKFRPTLITLTGSVVLRWSDAFSCLFALQCRDGAFGLLVESMQGRVYGIPIHMGFTHRSSREVEQIRQSNRPAKGALDVMST